MSKKQRQYNEAQIVFSPNVATTAGLPHAKRKKRKKMNLDTNLTPSTKINSKWITDLNIKPKPLKPLEDYIRKNLDELWNGNDFLIFSKWNVS